MSPLARLAAAAAIVLAVGGLSAFALSNRGGGLGGTPRPSVSSVTFTSPRYGYEVAIPATWNAAPATEPWPGGDGIEPQDPPYADVFRLEGSPDGASARVKARAVLDGTTAATWLAQYEATRAVGGQCFGSATPWTDTTVAGHPAQRYEWRCDGSLSQDARPNYDEYTFLAGGMGYVITGTPSMAQLLVRSFQAP